MYFDILAVWQLIKLTTGDLGILVNEFLEKYRSKVLFQSKSVSWFLYDRDRHERVDGCFFVITLCFYNSNTSSFIGVSNDDIVTFKYDFNASLSPLSGFKSGCSDLGVLIHLISFFTASI